MSEVRDRKTKECKPRKRCPMAARKDQRASKDGKIVCKYEYRSSLFTVRSRTPAAAARSLVMRMYHENKLRGRKEFDLSFHRVNGDLPYKFHVTITATEAKKRMIKGREIVSAPIKIKVQRYYGKGAEQHLGRIGGARPPVRKVGVKAALPALPAAAVAAPVAKASVTGPVAAATLVQRANLAKAAVAARETLKPVFTAGVVPKGDRGALKIGAREAAPAPAPAPAAPKAAPTSVAAAPVPPPRSVKSVAREVAPAPAEPVQAEAAATKAFVRGVAPKGERGALKIGAREVAPAEVQSAEPAQTEADDGGLLSTIGYYIMGAKKPESTASKTPAGIRDGGVRQLFKTPQAAAAARATPAAIGGVRQLFKTPKAGTASATPAALRDGGLRDLFPESAAAPATSSTASSGATLSEDDLWAKMNLSLSDGKLIHNYRKADGKAAKLTLSSRVQALHGKKARLSLKQMKQAVEAIVANQAALPSALAREAEASPLGAVHLALAAQYVLSTSGSLDMAALEEAMVTLAQVA